MSAFARAKGDRAQSSPCFARESRFAKAKRFATKCMFADKSLAKSTIDNGGAGRAAKGANPIGYTKKSTSFDKMLVVFYSSRKAWYVITACCVCNLSFGLITYNSTELISYCFADYIHASV